MTNDDTPRPQGTLALQTIAMPENANWNGDIFGGWLVSQMDLAGAVTARARANGRVATVAIDSMAFLRPVPVGAVVSCYTRMQDIGRSSMQILVEVWIVEDNGELAKVTEGHFTFVAIDQNGRTRAVPRD
ncbi:acyl-CoA thioesterase [Alloalcanivorax profundimaris]|uniref:Acyl-CoA thioester hydrolase n=1 Tax=Alloalcanivorax profundimaris TaxID=2735259 RepID=A0ABS0ALD0_9GAMM|nr:acyl-CoA thioesterase [Alloalcanivorax profundimaris]MAO58452.1 acyl-CoA thioesterase [Alcanivorax sp.]MCQ6260447.1 acyl-CoA thioesterase [Alcanivorax sp. MM125-6]UWN50235.1 putative acyl-CoA thioester hydrolase [Alcanivorax sp. ALC70]MAY10277.1 acyl-CoA thioesterase [Alcanivorax sp.]MBF1803189.1 acyl-CoA thioesterase [Alloalcanivorax profundimaris]|tara:strand:+ start:202 stop:591 length:390 start_codon:yes stop_codon:yes gene_type:complete